MWKFLLGPLLLGAVCLFGSIYGADAEQVVHKPPSKVRAAVREAIAVAPSGTVPLDGGQPLSYEMRIERISDEQMVVTMMMNGKQGAETQLRFTPQNDGKDTLVTANVHTEHAVMREALAGSSKAKLGYAPDWVFNLTIRPLLKKFAEQTEQGGAMDGLMDSRSRGDMSPEEERQLQEWRQYDATRPAVDPNQAARNYLSGGAR
jgi:hypothetical protein